MIGEFVEVYVKTSVEEVIRRNVKGLYAKALAGEIPHFTGVSDPYEEPEYPDVVVNTEQETVDESVTKILSCPPSTRVATSHVRTAAPPNRE